VFNVCPSCGTYAADKDIDPVEPAAICPSCGHRHPFQRLPLFVLTGASGSGKTSVCLRLPAALPECVTLETDILWSPAFDQPETAYHAFREAWLRLAKNVGQSGRPVVLCGTTLPSQFEACVERRYVGAIHYVALVCDDSTLAARLTVRPAWRQAGSAEFVDRMVRFNRWLIANADSTDPPLSLLDTSARSIDETVQEVAAWVRARL
jgi:hypothetical protein